MAVLTTNNSMGTGTDKLGSQVGLLLIPSLIKINTKIHVTEAVDVTGLVKWMLLKKSL